ncbi:RNA-binding domain-containing protein [Rhizopogon salebrosus TDB-379]|nr:RNA-binding domain-containing protein [Rhizopogon salebrosus TDB-379]
MPRNDSPSSASILTISRSIYPLTPYPRQPKGLAYVTFKQLTSALSAYETLDKRSFQGRLLHIIPAVDRKGKFEVVDGEGKKKTLKDERSSRRKATASREFNWMASSIADRMGIAKADIPNPEPDNTAVKLALVVTHVVQEMKSYLDSQAILVKNIPYGTTAEQIREMFEVHGELSRVVVPPAGTMAVVEFVHADEAAKAFRAVAYRRLGNSIIYLENGPMGTFQETTDEADGAGHSRTLTSTAIRPITIAEQEGGTGVGEDERLLRPIVHGAKAPRLSMGYGFVGFKADEDTKKAMKSMQSFVLDGHALHVKFAGRGTEDEPKDKNYGAHTFIFHIIESPRRIVVVVAEKEMSAFNFNRDHEKLPVDHPFYDFVKVTLQHVVESPLVLRYMAQNTLQNEPLPDEVMGEQRVQEIIQYLKINCPTVSGSDSATMYPTTLVATRAYLGCGQDRKSRKLARKHVYIQKSLIDGWMERRSDPNSSRGHFFLLTFLMKLCLLRGLIVAVKIAFMSEDIDAKNLTHGPPRPVHDSSSSFECLLCEWNVWLRLRYFYKAGIKYNYDPDGIIFSVGLCHVRVSASLCEQTYSSAVVCGRLDGTSATSRCALHGIG